MHTAAGTRTQISHGDAHPANTLISRTDLALIDFEMTARRPIGYDHAKLWIFCRSDPGLRSLVWRDVGTDPQTLAGFWTAVVLVAAREILSHRRHADLPNRLARLAELAADLRHALTRIDALRRHL